MPRNRIIHNVQDVFVGSTVNEKDNLITGVAGHEILKRLQRVQSFNYSIDIPKNNVSSLGRSKPFSRTASSPPVVNLSLSYLLAGVNNEKRIGLNTNNENETSFNQKKCIVHDMVSEIDHSERSCDKRNIYLTVNSKETDIHEEETYNPVYTSNFTSTYDGWQGYNSSTFGNVQYDGNLPYGGGWALRYRANDQTTNHYAFRDVFEIGKTYRISGKLYIRDGSNVTNVVMLDEFWELNHEFKEKDKWIDFVIIHKNARHKRLYLFMNGGSQFGGSGDVDPVDEFLIKDFKVEVNVSQLPHSLLYNNEFTKDDIVDLKSPDYALAAFQNCYLTQYRLDVSVGELPQVQLEYVADSIVGYSKGSGINVPYLDIKSGISTDALGAEASSYIYTMGTTEAAIENEGWTVPVLDPQDDIFDAVTDVDPDDLSSWALALAMKSDHGSSEHYIYNDLLTIGKNYKITGKVLIPLVAGQQNVHSMYVTNANKTIGGYCCPAPGTWAEFTGQIVAEGGRGLYLRGAKSDGSFEWSANDNDVFYFKDITVTEVKEIIVPRPFTKGQTYLDDRHHLTHAGDINVSISKVGVSGVKGIYDDAINSCSISCSLNRTDMSHVGHKLISDRIPILPVEASMSIETLSQNDISGSFLDDMKENEDYNIKVEVKYSADDSNRKEVGAIYTFSGAKFNGVSYSNSIGTNRTASMDFSTFMDLEDKSAGLYASGQLVTAYADVVYGESEQNVVNNNDNEVVSMPLYMQY